MRYLRNLWIYEIEDIHEIFGFIRSWGTKSEELSYFIVWLKIHPEMFFGQSKGISSYPEIFNFPWYE